MPDPLFSILIAQYNNGQYFKDCYDSIMAQTYSNWEVIIVDDCSKDDSVEQMKKMIGDDPRFKIFLNDENRGCGFTKRKCAELASGEICAFLDPDDAITEEALQVMVAEHEKYPEASMIYSKPMVCNEKMELRFVSESRQIVNGDPQFFDFDGDIFAFMAFKKSYYDRTEGINSYLQRAIDKDLVMKLYEVGPAFLCNQAFYKYRIHERGISNIRNVDKAYFWFWVTIIDAAKRRNVDIENLFIEKALTSRKQISLQKEIDSYNQSMIFKVLRKIGLFKI